jgi:hypothetical protein
MWRGKHGAVPMPYEDLSSIENFVIRHAGPERQLALKLA